MPENSIMTLEEPCRKLRFADILNSRGSLKMRITKMFGRGSTSELNFYSEKEREILLDEDEITAEEAGFMEGWEKRDFE